MRYKGLGFPFVFSFSELGFDRDFQSDRPGCNWYHESRLCVENIKAVLDGPELERLLDPRRSRAVELYPNFAS